jgi:hypothetical protein
MMTDEQIIKMWCDTPTTRFGGEVEDAEIIAFARALLSASKPAAELPFDTLKTLWKNGSENRDLLEGSMAHAFALRIFAAQNAASPAAPIHEPATEFKAGICVALQAITACDNGVLWSELVRACGTDEMLYYAAHVEPAEWELAGFAKYARAELGKKKPAKRASPPDSGKQEPTRWQKAQMAFGGGELTDAAPAQSDKQFAIYQLRMANGSWIDQTEQSYKSNIEQGHGGSVRVLYAISQTAQPGEKR